MRFGNKMTHKIGHFSTKDFVKDKCGRLESTGEIEPWENTAERYTPPFLSYFLSIN